MEPLEVGMIRYRARRLSAENIKFYLSHLCDDANRLQENREYALFVHIGDASPRQFTLEGFAEEDVECVIEYG